MKIKQLLFSIILVILLIEAGIFVTFQVSAVATSPQPDPGTTTTAAVKYVDSSITADGKITAQNQATLHFQTGGKLVSLPFKEGDQVAAGQTIAQLDTYALQRQLQLAANTYETAKNSTEQTQENQQANILEGQQRSSFDTTNHNAYDKITEVQVIKDTVDRIVDNSLLAQNTAQINVQLANYAVQLSTLTSPLNGIVTQEDVTVPNVNVTPQTSFTVADPSTMVFRANIPAGDIDYVSQGDSAEVAIDGRPNKINGTVTKIYPSKIALPNGEEVYQVDIQSDDLTNTGKLDQSGTAIIMTNNENVTLVPTWTVLGGKYIWVNNNGGSRLRTITTGKTHGGEIEITGGLDPQDRVIIDPKSIPSKEYQLL